MKLRNVDETICALCTPPGKSSVAVIRVSGNKALDICQKIFTKELKKPRYFYFGKILKNQSLIDEALCVFFKGPSSFTGEDVVEFHVHGGPEIVKKTIELLLNQGATYADPGEFSYRAFINNKIDLVKAESISNIINSDSDTAFKNSILNFSGEINKKFNDIRELGISLLANIESRVDFPEDEVPEINKKEIIDQFAEIIDRLTFFVSSYKKGALIMNGVKVLILGPPNVGKSSLMNRIVLQDKSIVSDIPGTTRDVIHSEIVIKGIKFNFFDVAGIRDSNNPIEKQGIKKAMEKIDYSDIVLHVLDDDSCNNLESSDQRNLKIPRGKRILVLNKIDKLTKSQLSACNKQISEIFKDTKLVHVSAKENSNIDLLENALIERVVEFDDNDSEVLMTSNRQYTLSQNAIKNFIEARNLFEQSFHLEIVVEEIRAGIDCIAQITGEISNEDIYDVLFSTFCIGK